MISCCCWRNIWLRIAVVAALRNRRRKACCNLFCAAQRLSLQAQKQCWRVSFSPEAKEKKKMGLLFASALLLVEQTFEGVQGRILVECFVVFRAPTHAHVASFGLRRPSGASCGEMTRRRRLLPATCLPAAGVPLRATDAGGLVDALIRVHPVSVLIPKHDTY